MPRKKKERPPTQKDFEKHEAEMQALTTPPAPEQFSTLEDLTGFQDALEGAGLVLSDLHATPDGLLGQREDGAVVRWHGGAIQVYLNGHWTKL